MTYRLKSGDHIRVRQRPTDDWTDAVVVLASDTQPSSVMLQLAGPVRVADGFAMNGLAVTIDYEKETVTGLITGLFGDDYEIEVRGEQATYSEET